MKPTDQNGNYINTVYTKGQLNGKIVTEMLYDKAFGVKVDTAIGVVKATAGYTVFKDGKNYSSYGADVNLVPICDIEDNKIWNVGVAFDIAKDLAFTADYLKSNFDELKTKTSYDYFSDDYGFVIGLNFKGAKVSETGTYGVYANYYNQPRGTVIAHTMNGYHGGNGFEGHMIGANYTLAKNIVAALEWYNLKSKGVYASTDGGVLNTPKQDMKTLWAQVVVTF